MLKRQKEKLFSTHQPGEPKANKVHVGCGPHNIKPGWINVDIRRFDGVDRVMDVTETWPFDREYSQAERVRHSYTTNRAFHEWGHQFLFDAATLEYFLTKLGFADIEFCKYGESRHRDLQGVEQHGGFSEFRGLANTLNVEASGKGSFGLPSDLIGELEENFVKYVRSGHQ